MPTALASAKKSTTIMDATREVLGFDGAAVRAQAFDDFERLGVDRLRILVWWRDVAPKPTSKSMPSWFVPTDSTTYGANGHRWGGLDTAVRMAQEHGLVPYLVPSGGPVSGVIPRWAARKPGRGAIDPRPAAYGDFLQALGERYSGGFDPDGLGPEPVLPPVKAIGIWNEANNSNYLLPQRRKGRPYSPGLYRKLYLQARAGLAAGGWKGKVYIGETAPQGVLTNLAPIPFLRGVLCLNARYKRKGGCRRLAADGWAHHPYSLSDPPWRKPRNAEHVSIASMGRLTRALNRAARARAIARGLPILITEFGYQSVPDRNAGLPLLRQAEFMAIAERIAHQNPRVTSFAQYLLRDDASLNGFQTGLRFNNSGAAACGGRRAGCKPSFHGFRMPLAVRIQGRKVSVWGHVRHATGRVRVTVRFRDRGGRTRKLKKVTTDSTGYFVFKSSYREGRLWGLSWDSSKGPLVRGYRY